jgi:hypothetical protein
MRTIHILHHLGLGDHISCHGIVRHNCELFDKVFLFVYSHNIKNVSRMYKDIKNIDFIEVTTNNYEVFIQNYYSNNKIESLLQVGFAIGPDVNFEVQFYNMASVPIEFKYSKFFIERDLEKEIKIFEDLNLKKNEYIFVHDGGWKLREEFFTSNLKIVKPENYDFFDWMYVIENAKEIHCIDSAFICLVDCMDTKDIQLYNHRYVRNYPEHIKLYTNKNWIFLK